VTLERLPTVEEAAARIRERNPHVRAVLLPTLEAAAARDAELLSLPPAQRGPLHRLPFVLKDVWDVEGLRTTSGSARRALMPPAPQSGTVVRAFQDQGAILVGKSNLSDRVFTPESANSLWGPVCNPHDLTRTAGGSSGGGAAAVADGMAAFDWGSDFGGSLRLPAAFCGVVGMRLSASVWPVVGHHPEIPGHLGLNGMGPLATSVALCRTLLETAKPSLRRPTPEWDGQGLCILSPDPFSTGEWPGFQQELSALWSGTEATPLEAAALPSPRDIDRAFASLLGSHLEEFFAGERRQVVRDALGALLFPWGKRWMHPDTARVLATLALTRVSVYRSSRRAWERVREVRAAAARIFDSGKLIVSPTTTFPAPLLGQAVFARGIAAFVKLGNVLDATCVAIPFGKFAQGLPRSVQILGPPGSENAVLRMAERLQRAARERGL